MAGWMADWFVGGSGASMKDFNYLGAITKPVGKFIVSLFEGLPTTIGASLVIVVGIAMVMLSVIYLGKLLQEVMTGKAKDLVHNAIGGGPVIASPKGVHSVKVHPPYSCTERRG